MSGELSPREAWERVARGEARIVDLRTAAERRRYGAPPGAAEGSFVQHALRPEGGGTIYLCQHGVRSRVAGRGDACGVAGGFAAWVEAGLPVEPAGDPFRLALDARPSESQRLVTWSTPRHISSAVPSPQRT